MKVLLHSLWASLITTLCNASPAIPSQEISADSTHFEYLGRLDFSREKAVGFIWQASTATTEFTGNYLAIGFANLHGQVYFDVHVDNQTHIIAARNGWIEIPVTSGSHRLHLFKRSEANAGRVDFLGIRIAANATIQRPQNVAKQTKYIFYGDSITVGACNEDGADDQWEDRRTHNSARSYAALTSAAMNADHQNISVSGVGIVTGYEPYTAGQFWNRMSYAPHAPLAPLQNWQPDVVFLNYGENDDSYSKKQGQPFPANYTEDYVALVRAMRKAYPNSHIVLLRGGMYGGARSERLRPAWEKAVAQLEKEDRNLSHYIFKHWSTLHPRVSDHEKMAEELVAWLRTAPLLPRK